MILDGKSIPVTLLFPTFSKWNVLENLWVYNVASPMLIECSSGYFPNLAINCQNKCLLVVIKVHFDSVKSYNKSIQHDELNHPVAFM